MNIDPSEQLAGLPILEIRRLLRRLKRYHGILYLSYGGYLRLVPEILDISPYQARQVGKALKREGYVERYRGLDNKTYWTTSLHGNALALASAARPLRRATAEKKLAEFLNRVRHVRDSSEFLYKVKKVVVFGSYLSSKERISDIDLALSLSWKEQDCEKRRKLTDEKIDEALTKGRQFRRYDDELWWPHDEVRLFLKGRSRSLSLHGEDRILTMTESKVIYEDDE